MKILDIPQVTPLTMFRENHWEARMDVLGNAQPNTYMHVHQWHHTCVEWRIAEYEMDPNDIDSILHLILHEHVINGRTEVTCYTPGFTPKEALAYRLTEIQGHIDRHAKRMTDVHRKMRKYEPHKHPALDPVREVGIRDELLQPRLLLVQGILAKKNGKKNYGADKIREAHALLAAEQARVKISD